MSDHTNESEDEEAARRRVLARIDKRHETTEADNRIRKLIVDEITKYIKPYIIVILLVFLFIQFSWLGIGGLVVRDYCCLRIQAIRRIPDDGVGDLEIAQMDGEHYVLHCIIAEHDQRSEFGK